MHCMLNLRREWQEIGGCNNNQAVVNKSLGNLVEDELFLVPREVLDMDSSRVREDLFSCQT